MKRLNRKGFTLVELMAVIAILIIIIGIALPNITSSIERSKNKQKDAKKELIISSAELYFDRHSTADKTNGVNVSDLIAEQEIPGIELEDVCTNTSSCCVRYDNVTFKYEIVSTCPNAS